MQSAYQLYIFAVGALCGILLTIAALWLIGAERQRRADSKDRAHNIAACEQHGHLDLRTDGKRWCLRCGQTLKDERHAKG